MLYNTNVIFLKCSLFLEELPEEKNMYISTGIKRRVKTSATDLTVMDA